MALIQNGNGAIPPQLDYGPSNVNSIQNGNKESPPQLDDGVVKVVVIGEPRCGKTRFIRAYYDHHFPSDIYTHNGVRVYPCEIVENTHLRRASIFEIPGNPNFFLEQRMPHYEEADIIVFMYAIDDPSSLQMLTEKWIVEVMNIIDLNTIPVVFVGTKIDLREDQQVVERLALKNRRPVTLQQGRELLNHVPGDRAVMECSGFDLQQIELIFNTIMAIVVVNE